ncbi:hypothetical protein [Anaeromassilibacillus sp. SJQ-5]|jgi:hypothetical protein
MGLRVSVLYAHQTALSNGFRNPNFVGKVQISAEILFQWTGRRFFSGAVGIAAKAGMKAWFSVKAIRQLEKSHRVSCRLPSNMENNYKSGF